MIDVVNVGRIPAELQEVADDLVEILRVQNLLVERGRQRQLGVQLQPAHPREIVLLRVEEHALKQRPRTVEGRRVAWAQPAIDLDERLFVRADRVLLERGRQHRSGLVAFGEEDLERLDGLLLRHRDDARRDLLIGFQNYFAGGRVDHIGGGEGPLELGVRHLDRLDAGCLQRSHRRTRDLLARTHHFVVAGQHHVRGRPAPDERLADLPAQRAPLHLERVDRVERPDDLVRAAQPKRAQEHGRQELALPIDADVEQVLRVVFELDPRPAIRNDLRDERRLVRRVEERPGRTVELRDDDALGAVDDERAVVRHQRDIAEVDLLLLDVADGLDARLGILVPHDKADGHLQGHGVGHAAFLAFVDVVLQFELDVVAADVADVTPRDIGATALGTEHLVRPVRGGHQLGPAARARHPQVLQARQPPALALPVADRILDELERRVLAEIADRKDRLEHRLQARVLALGRQPVHLQKAFVRLPLNLDEIGNRYGRADLRKIDAFAVDVLGQGVHAWLSPGRGLRTTPAKNA